MSLNEISGTVAEGYPEIATLVVSLHETQRRLEALTAGEIDTVLFPNGQTFLLLDAQKKLQNDEAVQRASAAMQTSILNAMPAHIALIDFKGVIISVNEGWLRFAGSNALEGSASSVGQNYLEICERASGPCSEEAREAAAGIREVLADNLRQFSMEYPCHSPVEQRWFRLMVSPIADSGKHGAVVMHVDVTTRRLAEEAVRESEERFRGLYNAAATGIAVSTPDGRYLQANAAYCQMLGYTEKELQEMTFSSITHPDDLRKNLNLRDELVAGKREGFVMEKRYIKKGGAIVWTRHSVSATRGPDGKPKTLIVVAEDITEQKLAVDEVRRSAALLSMASRVGRTGAWTLDFPSMDVTWSAGMRAIHEVPPDYIPNLADGIEFYLPEYRDPVRAALDACARKGTAFDFEAQILTARGKPVWVRAIGEQVRSYGAGAPGVNTRIQGAFQDITIRKAGEEELARINRALKMLSSCNVALIRAENEQGLLDEICRIAIEHGGYRMAWVGFAEDDASRSITPVAHFGVEEGYLSEIKVTWNENEPTGLGLAGEVIRSGRAAISEDISNDPAFSQWRSVALQHGYRSAIVLPLRDGERTFGLLALHSAESKPTSGEEIKLLQELADDLAFGILNLRARTDKDRMENAVVKVAASVSTAGGKEFFEQLNRNMAEALGAQASLIVRMLPGEASKGRTIAAQVEGVRLNNFEYSLEGTPCEELLVSDACLIAKDAAKQFPGLGMTADLGAEGVACQRLVSSEGEPLGLLCAIFRKPISQVDFVKSTLQIFATRAAAELERQETDERLRDQARLLDIAHDAIHVNNLDNQIIYWNKGAERIYGWHAAEVLGRLADEMLHHDSAQSLEALKTLVSKDEWRGETTKRTKDGRSIIVEAHWTLVRDKNGRAKSILAIDTDITERKQLENQFLRAQRLESIGTLASGLAHDLNNILAPIMMCAPLLRGDLPPGDKERMVSAIESSASRGAKIISQVLTFGRGTQGERHPMHIASIINEIKAVADETFPKNIRIEPTIAAGLCNIIGDSTQWHQVLMNLCVNARDAMPDGGTLRITAENVLVDAHYAKMSQGLSEGPHIAIEVADSGTGIPPEVAERIFDPFFTTKSVGKGTGLGLSTVLGIVKSHGGVIKLTTRPGMGTTFRILVPADDSDADACCESAAPLDAVRGETILLADDEEHVLDAARTILEKNGYRALLAADGVKALALYAQHADTIDAVLTDITMPFMDGIALIKALQRMRPGLPIIATTGQDERVRDLKSLGLVLILKKPYGSELLMRALDTALKPAREKASS
jgi:PAS domain S-box-containing protein